MEEAGGHLHTLALRGPHGLLFEFIIVWFRSSCTVWGLICHPAVAWELYARLLEAHRANRAVRPAS